MSNEMLKNIKIEIESYYDHYVYLADMMAVYQHISDVLKTVKENDAGINFLKITYAATIDSMMITFARLYDEDGNSKNINQLIEKCRKNSSLSIDKLELEKQLECFKNKLCNDEYLVPAVKTIKMRRDKMFAHNDKKFFNNPEKDTSYLPMYQLWFLRDYTKDLLQMLAHAYQITFSKDVIYDQDLNELVYNRRLK